VTQVILLLLLMVVCANVGVLVYARTVTRTGEIAVRTALGASRHRIVGQLFVESLVLSGAAAAVGLGLAAVALGHMNALLDAWTGPGGAGGLPFWVRFQLQPSTVLFVIGCAIVAAAAVGVVPSLRVAGGRLQASLRQLGGGTGMQLGRTWTALIVAQVALTVAFLPAAVSAGWKSLLHATADPGFAASEYVAALVVLDADVAERADPDEYMTRYARVQRELQQRLGAEPGVAAVTWALDMPGMEPTVAVEVDGVPVPDGAAGHAVRFARVDDAFFDAFDVPLLAGRPLHVTDAAEGATAVVVNAAFVRDVLGGGDAVGRQFRYTRGYRSGGVERTPAGVDMQRWYQIVGMVPDFPRAIDPDDVMSRIYHPLAAGRVEPHRASVAGRVSGGFPPAAVLLVRGGPSPEGLAARLRSVAAAVDPAVQLRNVRSLEDALRETQGALRMAALVLALVMGSVLLLSAAGIYALMSFAVARRRREIGIRAALGADSRRILSSIFSRALAQLGTGVLIGLVIAGLLQIATNGEMIGVNVVVLLPIVATIMVAVGTLAALGPARQGLRIQPTEALREE
jgi:putative ABC transport system permease protein